MADNMPDFDKMSPEEIMAWMETLAKRQGASEGFTTAADASIAEIDASTVVIDEPGYVPYDTKIGDLKPGAVPKTAPPPAQAAPPSPASGQPARSVPPPPPSVQQPPPAPPPTRSAPQPVPPAPPSVQQPPPTPPPTRSAPQPVPPARSAPPPPSVQQPPARSAPPPPPSAQQPPARSAPPPPPSVQQPPARSAPPPPPSAPPAASAVVRGGNEQDGMQWFETLASEQEESLFNLDLSDVPGDFGGDNSMAWLENLAASAPVESAPVMSAPAVSDDPFASGGNPIAWLEQLAREQGGKPEEMTTASDFNLDIGLPDFSNLGGQLEPLSPQDPTNFLESLSATKGDPFDVSAVIRDPAPPSRSSGQPAFDLNAAVADGSASPAQMQAWLEMQTDKLMEADEIDLTPEFDPEAPAIPAELPSWLVESFGMPPSAPPSAPDRPSLESLFADDEPTMPAAMPDWLQPETSAPAVMDLQSIFADDEPTLPIPMTPPIVEPPAAQRGDGDPWAEAFDDEYAQGAVDIKTVPDWYQRNVQDPSRVAAVERMVTSDSLPSEDKLQPGQPESVPSWLAEVVTPSSAAAPALVEDAMDWMEGLETTVSPDEIPSWLLETIDEPSSATSDVDLLDIDLEPAAPEPEPVRVVQAPPEPARVVPPTRAPEPVRASVSRDGLSLTEARRLSKAGSLADSLAQYEGMIRAQMDLEDVVDDLSSLSRQYRDNPSIFRVLGDGLMRQGKLQAALDTYRQALNQL